MASVILPKAVSEGCGKKDVLYLALTRKSCGTSTLYFSYLCSSKLFAIKTDYLRDGRTSGRIEGKWVALLLLLLSQIVVGPLTRKFSNLKSFSVSSKTFFLSRTKITWADHEINNPTVLFK